MGIDEMVVDEVGVDEMGSRRTGTTLLFLDLSTPTCHGVE